MDGFKPGFVLADKAYDREKLRALITGLGVDTVIPCTPT